MKHLPKLVLISFALLLTACFGNSPKDVVKDFFNAIAAEDFETATSLCTENAKPLVGMMQAAMSMDPGAKEEIKKAGDVEIIKEEINGDKAKVTIKNPDGEEDTVDLTKVDGEWKIDIEK